MQTQAADGLSSGIYYNPRDRQAFIVRVQNGTGPQAGSMSGAGRVVRQAGSESGQARVKTRSARKRETGKRRS